MAARICVDATPMDSAHRTRGIGRYVSNLRARLLEIAPNLLYLRLNPTASDCDIAISRPAKPRVRLQWLWNQGLLPLELGHKKIDIFHATDFRGIPRTSKAAVIATAYDLIPLRFKSQLWKDTPVDERIFQGVVRENYRSCDHLIAISQSVKSDFMELYGIASEKITVIPLGFDDSVFSVRQPALGEVPSASKPYFLYVGGFDYRKNVQSLLLAFSRIKDTVKEDLFLVGKRTAAENALIHGKIAELKIEKRVRLFDFVPDPELSLLYNHATCFAFPSLYEGFGLPVLESFACGCPVVCFEAGAVKEVALDAAIVCTNLDEFTEGLRTVSCSSAISEVLREKGLLRVKDFSWHKCARETYSVYQRFS